MERALQHKNAIRTAVICVYASSEPRIFTRLLADVANERRASAAARIDTERAFTSILRILDGK